MAKKKGKAGGKKGKKGAKVVKIAPETTKEMVQERELLKTTGMPLGARYGLKRRADAIRLEVAGARLKSCMLKKDSVLSLRGLSLEECPEEFTKGVPPFETMWHGLLELDLSHNMLYKTPELFDCLACLGGHLQKLDLSSNSLAGEIPASAGSLVALTDLKATQNRFTAIHPDAAAGWGQMEVLNLNRNVLTSLPTTAGAWVELKSLDLRANKLTALDEEALGAWTKMERILNTFILDHRNKLYVAKLGMNQIAVLPPTIGACTQLKRLYVTDNKIAALPLELAQCAGMIVLHCGVNLLKELPPELFGAETPLTQLNDLELYRNKLTSLPEDFGKGFAALSTLSLSGNALKAVPAGVASGCLELKELHLANNAKLAKVPEELNACGKLEYVSLAGCAAVKALPQSLVAAWLSLRELDVRSGAKKEKCKLTAEWVEAAAARGFLLRGGIPPKKKKGKKGKK